MKTSLGAKKMYDDENVFAKILKGEVPAKKVFENEFALAFYDAFPKAPYHILVIPKGKYTDFQDFSLNATDAEIVGYVRAVGEVAKQFGFKEKDGFNLIANIGEKAGQAVFHFHTHIVSGVDIWGKIKSE